MNIEDVWVITSIPIRQVMARINQTGLGVSVVVDDKKKVVATITDGDIRRAILDGIDLDLPIQTLLDRRISSAYGRPITADINTDHVTLLNTMRLNGIRHIPVVDEDGCLVDIAVFSSLIQQRDLPVTAVVMAGGYGTRLRPLTEQLPKPMLPVGDRPLLELIIEQLSQSGIRKVNLATHYKKDVISKHFGNGSGFGVDIFYIEENEPLGTAGALGLMETQEQPLLVINGDILTNVDFRAMLDFHSENIADMTIAVRQHEFQIPYGVVEIDGVTVKSVSEKPIVKHLINAGIYLMNPTMLKFIPPARPYNMTDFIDNLINHGCNIASFPIDEYWLDIGHQADYAQAQSDVQGEEFRRI